MNLEKFNPVIPESEDGFVIEVAGPYFIEKSHLIRHYLQVFSGTMKRKFNYLVYIDLFSGSGLKRLENGEIISGPPSLALAHKDPFAKYIFCVNDQAQCDALRVRTNKYHRDKNVAILNGSPDNLIDKLVYYIPESSKRHKVGAICLVDPHMIEIEFETIRLLGELGVYFLVVLDFPWKEEDTFYQYIEEQRESLNNFLGEPWSRYEKEITIESNEQFFRNLVKIYHKNLRSLGYIAQGTFHKTEAKEINLKEIFVGYYSHNGINKVDSGVHRENAPQVSLFESNKTL